jgi:pimeloyl-ACP methyl ester carboxylesterase
MKEAIEERELIVLDGLGGLIRGTYHKAFDNHGGEESSKSSRLAQDRVGVLFLNSTSPTRAANGDAAVYLADSFAECGYPSFRIDLPGFGDSEGDPGEDLIGFINRGGYASVASAKVSELVARFNLSGVVIVGHCAGSVSALFTAAASRECRGLVLIGPYFFLPQAIRPAKTRKQPELSAHRRQFRIVSSKISGLAKEIRLFLRGSGLPENANYPLLRSWKKVASKGLPILILNGPDRKASGTKPSAGEFDYLKFVLRMAGRRSEVTVKVTDGANNAFANRQGRSAVRQHAEQWLNSCFPIAVNKRSGALASHREPGIRDNDYENRKQCLKV